MLDFGGLFSGVNIVQWMMEALDGISSEEEAESLGQLLVDKGALVHSEGSRYGCFCVRGGGGSVVVCFVVIVLLLFPLAHLLFVFCVCWECLLVCVCISESYYFGL